MATVTHVCTLNYVAECLDEDIELLEAILEDEDNMTYGNIVNVYTGNEIAIVTLTDDGIDEIKDMLKWARVSKDAWQNFLEDFVADPEIISRVKDQRPR